MAAMDATPMRDPYPIIIALSSIFIIFKNPHNVCALMVPYLPSHHIKKPT
ncbi:hypothetical protein Hanom_Chr15g01377191 [Helianthus anomalus]